MTPMHYSEARRLIDDAKACFAAPRETLLAAQYAILHMTGAAPGRVYMMTGTDYDRLARIRLALAKAEGGAA